MDRVVGRALLCAALFGVTPALGSCGSAGGGATSSGVAVEILTTDIPPAFTGQEDYSVLIEAQFEHAPGTFQRVSGMFPPGVELDPLTGEIRGIPRGVGNFRFTIAAQDGQDLDFPSGRDTTFEESRRTFDMVVTRGPPNLLDQQLPAAPYRVSYSYQIDAAGGTPPYTFADISVPPAGLPTGLTLSRTGLVGVFPTSIGDDGLFDFDVRVTDAAGLTDEKRFQIRVIVRPLLIGTPSPLPNAAAEFPYSIQLDLASDGGGTPFVWSQAPPGPDETLLSDIDMEINSAGVVRNMPSTPGPRRDLIGPFAPPYTVKFSARVTDEPLQEATRQYELTVNPGPVLLAITPNRSSLPGPYTVTGLNFQPGAILTFKPGPGEVVMSPTFIDSSTLRFTAAPGTSFSGGVPVKVTNPDTGHFTRPAAFVFPASTIDFAVKGFISSALSSTGLACGDLDGDGFADVVHCGAVGVQPCSGAAASTAAGLVLLRNAGVTPLAFNATTLSDFSFYDVKLADLNVDGRPDIVALGATQLYAWLNGAGTDPLGTLSGPFTSSIPGGFSYPSEMSVGKLDSDGVPDVAFGVPNFPSQNPNGRVYTMKGTGTGFFTSLDSAVTTMPTTWGVTSLACADSDGDGRAEIVPGQGLNQGGTGPILTYVPTQASGLLGTWSTRGGPVSQPLYASTTGVVAGDFLGTGRDAVLAIMTGSINYSPGNFRLLALFSGAGLTTQTTLTPAPTAVTKCGTAVDADFDPKVDWAVSSHPSQILVYRGSTQTLVKTLDAAAGSPSVSSPLTGRLASGDLDGDGKPDLLATTSHWAVSTMATYYSTQYNNFVSGNGGSMGVVYFLNTSD